MLLGTLVASLLGNLLEQFRIFNASPSLTNFEIQRHQQKEPWLNDVYSRNNLPKCYTKTSDHLYLPQSSPITPSHPNPSKIYLNPTTLSHRKCPLTPTHRKCTSIHPHSPPLTHKKCPRTLTIPKYTSISGKSRRSTATKRAQFFVCFLIV